MRRRSRSAPLRLAGALGCLLGSLFAGAFGMLGMLALPATPASATTSATVSTDDTGGLALFSGGTDLMPGDSMTNCIVVSYTAPTPATLTMNESASGSATSDLNLIIDSGTGGSFGNCSGFTGSTIYSGTVASFAAAYGSGMPGLQLATGSTSGSVSLRIYVGLALSATTQGVSANVSFSWSVVSPDLAAPAPSPSPTSSPTPSPTPSPSDSASPSPSPSPTPSPTVSLSDSPSPNPLPSASSAPPEATTSVPVVSGGSGGGGSDSSSPVDSSAPSSGAAGVPGSPPASPGATQASPAGGGTVAGKPGTSGSGKGGKKGTSGTAHQPSSPVAKLFSPVLTPVEHFVGSVAAVTRRTAPAVAKGSGLPLTLLIPVTIFIGVQHRIDRRDPKLALAPTYPEPTVPFDSDPDSGPR